MEIINNILIIGKSGAGKSSLLNYLFGRNLEKTGTGRPVTEEGIFCHQYEIEDGFTANIYDTFGLEPGKTEKWRNMIREAIEEHDAASIRDWFHMIVYCFNANVARIEGFEVDILKTLVAEGNHVIIVFTHCDLPGAMADIEKTKPRFMELGIGENDIICVCNEEKTLLDGTVTKRFGREEILQKAKEAFWEKIVRRIPKKSSEEALALIDQAQEKCLALSKEHIKLYNIHSNKQYDKLNAACNRVFEETEKRIQATYVDNVREAVDYYVQLCGKFAKGTKQATSYHMDDAYDLHYTKKLSAKVSDAVKVAILVTVPLVQFLVPAALVRMHRKAYAESIAETADHMRQDVEKKEAQIRQYLLDNML